MRGTGPDDDPLTGDPELTRRATEELARRAAARAQSTRLLDPLLLELAEVGHPVNDVWDLVETKEKYPAAIPC